ncbi:MAG TPA: hypothetical protein VEB41_15765 [Burkholderiales bacterium]|nr:hypothetical protein [Burkholderiales bacterium]
MAAMEDNAFSDEFCRFIQDVIPAVDAAELLLFLADRPDLAWNLADALGKMRPGVNITDADAERYVESFLARGLLERGEGKTLRYRTESPDATSVRTLAQAYEERPVTLIRMIYALRDQKIRTFADAFRLRKK